MVVSMAQSNLLEFTNSIKLESEKLEKNQNEEIKKFMKLALKKKPELADENVVKVPVYSIFVYKKYAYNSWRNDSIFSVLNPNSILLTSVIAFTKEVKNGYIQIEAPYINIKDQAMYGTGLRNLPDIILKEKPALVMSLFDGDRIFIFYNKDNLTFWKYDDRKDEYEKMTAQGLLESLKNQYYLFDSNQDQFIPPIYVR